MIITPAYNKIKSNNLEYSVDEIKTDCKTNRNIVEDNVNSEQNNNNTMTNNGIEETENNGRR